MKRAIAIVMLLILAASFVMPFVPIDYGNSTVYTEECTIVTNDPTLEGDSVVYMTTPGEDL